MAWQCPKCRRINHSSPIKCQCGQQVRVSSTSQRSNNTEDGLDLIDIVIVTDTIINNSSSYSDSSYSDSSYSDSSSCSD